MKDFVDDIPKLHDWSNLEIDKDLGGTYVLKDMKSKKILLRFFPDGRVRRVVFGNGSAGLFGIDGKLIIF